MKDYIAITQSSDIQVGGFYTMKAVLFKIESEGKPDSKIPAVIVFKMSGSGEFVKISTWGYEKLQSFRDLMKRKAICIVSFSASEYRDSVSIKLDSVTDTGECDEPDDSGKADYKSLIDAQADMIADGDLKTLVKAMLVPEFFIWPAAKSIHHAYQGGLAEHTHGVVSVAINSLSLYQGNKGMDIDDDLVIAGALLHDIGKLDEYTSDGEISQTGYFLSHVVTGIERIDSACDALHLDKNSMKMTKLKHIVASHHGKYEFGSPNQPVIPEAFIVSQADSVDAKMEIVAETLECMQPGEASRPMGTLDGAKVVKL